MFIAICKQLILVNYVTADYSFIRSLHLADSRPMLMFCLESWGAGPLSPLSTPLPVLLSSSSYVSAILFSATAVAASRPAAAAAVVFDTRAKAVPHRGQPP